MCGNQGKGVEHGYEERVKRLLHAKAVLESQLAEIQKTLTLLQPGRLCYAQFSSPSSLLHIVKIRNHR